MNPIVLRILLRRVKTGDIKLYDIQNQDYKDAIEQSLKNDG